MTSPRSSGRASGSAPRATEDPRSAPRSRARAPPARRARRGPPARSRGARPRRTRRARRAARRAAARAPGRPSGSPSRSAGRREPVARRTGPQRHGAGLVQPGGERGVEGLARHAGQRLVVQVRGRDRGEALAAVGHEVQAHVAVHTGHAAGGSEHDGVHVLGGPGAGQRLAGVAQRRPRAPPPTGGGARSPTCGPSRGSTGRWTPRRARARRCPGRARPAPPRIPGASTVAAPRTSMRRQV